MMEARTRNWRAPRRSLVSLFWLSLLSPLASATTDISDNLASPLTSGCPQACRDVGSDPAKWTEIHSWSDLAGCNIPVLFGLNVQNPPSKFATMQTCAKYPASPARRHVLEERADVVPVVSVDDNCGAETSSIKTTASYGPSGALGSGKDASAAAGLLVDYLGSGAACGPTILFAKSGSTVVGLYVGAEVQKSSAADFVPNKLSAGSQVAEICNSANQQSQNVGLFAVDAISDIPTVQKTLQAWSTGKCVSISGQKSTSSVNLGILVPSKVQKRDVELRSRFTTANSRIAPRADCTAIQVKSGDSCASLATRCKVTTANFNKYNPAKNFCSTLVPLQWVCCSSGTLPDKRPKPQKDGTCYIVTIVSGDSCANFAANFGLTTANINAFNKNTWGWNGCDRLDIGQKICLSSGKNPMPKSISGAVCGPQKPGTGKPLSTQTGWDLAHLNPCPLNACCSGYGFCGITPEFCTNTTAKGGAPGSFAVGTAGCVQNCGNTIRNNTAKPAKFLTVGYFQGYNSERPCLNMDVANLTQLKTTYTHMHFAFAGLTSDYKPLISADAQAQFAKFVALKASFKKIISFGGWAGSTDSSTFQLYRDAIAPANRNAFATNVLAFLNQYKLDGVDFDWEYPGAASSAGASDTSTDATNYLAFLTVMRSKIGTSGKIVSVALPGSYWALKPFAVAQMAPLVDYIVFMTYDLHGQWDYGNQYAATGCPNGNCLRSHVNRTETHDSMSMITKAGVPANKIVVGVSSYGRSFRMANPSCTGPTCQFTGSFNTSLAEPGVCTGEAGVLANAEINDIIADAKAGKKGVTETHYYDSVSDSDIMMWSTKGLGNVNWVAFLSDATKQRRIAWVQNGNFLGTVDWAVDLQTWFSPEP